MYAKHRSGDFFAIFRKGDLTYRTIFLIGTNRSGVYTGYGTVKDLNWGVVETFTLSLSELVLVYVAYIRVLRCCCAQANVALLATLNGDWC